MREIYLKSSSNLCVKETVFPFSKFIGIGYYDPEMKSTGEVMGIGKTFSEAFIKSLLAAGIRFPTKYRESCIYKCS